ncbi:hypothetical protein GC174_14745 [bacterium]|nr:hypothetical protein [bacterium]
MTVNTTHATSPFTGDGVTDTFLFTFDINPLSYAVEVWIENVLQSEANYSVVPNPDQDTNPGGQIIFVTPPTLGDEGEVKRTSPLTQLQGFPKSGAINTLATESTFDKVMRIVQEVVLDISENTFRWRGEWSSLLTYQPGDAVYYGGSSYRAINTNLNSAPPSADWQTVVLKGDSGGLTWRGAWSSATSYVLGDGVTKDGGSYICNAPHTNQAPPNALYWDILAEGGEDGEMTGPVTSTDEGIPIFDGTGGSQLQDSGIKLPTTSLTGKKFQRARLNSTEDAFEFFDEAPTTLGIEADTITPTKRFHLVDTESAASTDALSTIEVGSIENGALLFIRSVNAGRVITVKHGIDNILLAGDADVALDDPEKWLALVRNGANLEEVRLLAGVGINRVESADQASTFNQTKSFAHSFGAVPSRFGAYWRCTSAEHGYAVGDRVPVYLTQYYHTGVMVNADATNVEARSAASGQAYLVDAARTQGLMTAGNWKLVLWAEE